MKKLLSVLLAAVFISVSGMTLSAVSANEDKILGVWKGSYGQTAGETGATLTVKKTYQGVRGRWEFYNLPGRNNAKSGSFDVRVTYNSATGRYFLKRLMWVDRPKGYVLLDFEGEIHRNVFSGQTSKNQPFRLVRAN
jgi:hypothetical protein